MPPDGTHANEPRTRKSKRTYGRPPNKIRRQKLFCTSLLLEISTSITSNATYHHTTPTSITRNSSFTSPSPSSPDFLHLQLFNLRPEMVYSTLTNFLPRPTFQYRIKKRSKTVLIHYSGLSHKYDTRFNNLSCTNFISLGLFPINASSTIIFNLQSECCGWSSVSSPSVYNRILIT